MCHRDKYTLALATRTHHRRSWHGELKFDIPKRLGVIAELLLSHDNQ